MDQHEGVVKPEVPEPEPESPPVLSFIDFDYPNDECDHFVDGACAVRSYLGISTTTKNKNRLWVDLSAKCKEAKPMFIVMAATQKILGHFDFKIAQTPGGICYVRTANEADAWVLDRPTYHCFGVDVDFLRVEALGDEPRVAVGECVSFKQFCNVPFPA